MYCVVISGFPGVPKDLFKFDYISLKLFIYTLNICNIIIHVRYLGILAEPYSAPYYTTS